MSAGAAKGAEGRSFGQGRSLNSVGESRSRRSAVRNFSSKGCSRAHMLFLAEDPTTSEAPAGTVCGKRFAVLILQFVFNCVCFSVYRAPGRSDAERDCASLLKSVVSRPTSNVLSSRTSAKLSHRDSGHRGAPRQLSVPRECHNGHCSFCSGHTSFFPALPFLPGALSLSLPIALSLSLSGNQSTIRSTAR